MLQYINGYDKPKFIIMNNNAFVDSIELNLTDSEGLTEQYEFIQIEHSLFNYSQTKYFAGFYIYFTLSYKSWSDAENSLKIKKLINYILSNIYTIYLIPRIDDNRIYIVNYVGDGLQLNIMKNKINAIGNRGLELKFRTKDKINKLDWTNPNVSTKTAIDDFATI